MLDVLSAVSTGINILSEGMEAEAENERAEEDYRNLVENVYEGTNLDLDMIEMQQRQIEDATNERVYQRELQALKDRSKIMVATGEANVGGPTVDRLLGHYEMDAAHDIEMEERNEEMQLQQSAMEGRSVVREAESAINQGKARRQQRTTENPWLQTGLRALPSAMGAYANYKTNQQVK